MVKSVFQRLSNNMGYMHLSLQEIHNAIIDKKVTPIQLVEEALELKSSEGTINDLIVAKTAKIGEKLSFRRFEIVEKTDDQLFGSYIHMGSKIGVLLVVNGTNDDNKVIKSLMKDYHLTRKEARFCVSQWFIVENSLRG